MNLLHQGNNCNEVMRVNVSTQDFEQIKDYLEGAEITISREQVANFFSMADELRSRMLKNLGTAKNEVSRLNRRLERYADQENKKIEEGNFDELGLDSVDIARALLYVMKSRKVYISHRKLQYALFIVYANWLATHRQKICIESPKAQEWGPWFWRVANNVKEKNVTLSTDFDNLMKINPGLGCLVKYVGEKYSDMNEDDIAKYLKKSEPYVKADASRNNGKWGAVLDDTLIYRWKASAFRRG